MTVIPLQLDSPDTVPITIEDGLDGFGLSSNDGVPEHETGIVVVGKEVVNKVVVLIVDDVRIVVVVSIVVDEIVVDTVVVVTEAIVELVV